MSPTIQWAACPALRPPLLYIYPTRRSWLPTPITTTITITTRRPRAWKAISWTTWTPACPWAGWQDLRWDPRRHIHTHTCLAWTTCHITHITIIISILTFPIHTLCRPTSVWEVTRAKQIQGNSSPSQSDSSRGGSNLEWHKPTLGQPWPTWRSQVWVV